MTRDNPDISKLSLKELAILVHETLSQKGIDSVLVGGACVTIYSENRYQSHDLDFVSYDQLTKIEKALVLLGFKREGRYFSYPDCPFFIDFVNPPVAIGNEPIKQFELFKTPDGTLKLLTPTDCVKDRLAAFYHWDDPQAIHQALLVAKRHPIDIKNIENWSENEGHLRKFQYFLKLLNSKK